MSRIIAYMVSTTVRTRIMCTECHDKSYSIVTRTPVSIPVTHENIYPYSQRCAACMETIVEGRGAEWPELYKLGTR